MLPYYLQNLAQVTGEVQVDVAFPVTITRVLVALEARYPQLPESIVNGKEAFFVIGAIAGG